MRSKEIKKRQKKNSETKVVIAAPLNFRFRNTHNHKKRKRYRCEQAQIQLFVQRPAGTCEFLNVMQQGLTQSRFPNPEIFQLVRRPRLFARKMTT
jgi:hypothetical protein